MRDKFPISRTLERPIKVAYLIPEQVWMASVVVGAEVFSAVDSLHVSEVKAELSSVSVSFLKVKGSFPQGFTGLSISVEEIGDDNYDVVIIPAVWRISSAHLEIFASAGHWINEQHRRGAIIVGLVTGVFYLAECGLLDHKTATTHWAFVDEFQHKYPKVRVNSKLDIIESDRIYCTSNYRASVDVILILIRHFFGERQAQKCDRYFALNVSSDANASTPSGALNTEQGDSMVEAFKHHISMNLNTSHTLESLSNHLNVSAKTLTRRCMQALGQTPIQYLQTSRLQHSKHLLLNTRYSMEIIAGQCGYSSSTVYGRAFKQAFMKTPSEYRKYVKAL